MAETVWFRSEVVTVGSFKLAKADFREDRPPGVASNLVVFPLSTHEITARRGGDPVITDRNGVLLYNRSESYRIRFIDPVDRCDFLSFSDNWALEIAGSMDPAALYRPGRPFDQFYTDSGPDLYWRARHLMGLATSARANRLEIEETALELARTSFTASLAQRPSRPPKPTCRAHRRLVEDVKELFAEARYEDWTIDTIAAAIGASPAHLSRVFREVTGTTMHRYRTQLRLRSSVDYLGSEDLSTIAIRHGFSSHSHFSAAFRSSFARTPSQARHELAST